MVLSSMQTRSCHCPPGSGDKTGLMENTVKETGLEMGLREEPEEIDFRGLLTFRGAQVTHLMAYSIQFKTAMETCSELGGGGGCIRRGVGSGNPQYIH